MRITVEDCLKLDAFSESSVVACKEGLGNRVRTISVLDEDNYEMGIERNGVPEQMVLTHFWNCKDDVKTQCEVVKGFGEKGIAALIIFLNENGVKVIDKKVAEAAEKSNLPIISIPDDTRTTYALLMEQVMDKILYGHNYSDNILNNTIYHLLNFDKHSSFQSALKEAALKNNYQIVLMTAEFNPILTIETRHKETIDNAIRIAKKYDITHSSVFTKVNIGDVITYWGTIEISGAKHILMIVDNEDNYSATEVKKLAEVIELAMGMWKYTPERDSRAEFIKASIRGDVAFCHTLLEEAGLKDKKFISVYFANGINNSESQDILNDFCREYGFNILPYIETDECYGMIYADFNEEKGAELKSACLKMYDILKEGRKDVRIFHSTGIEDLDMAIDGFKMINETWNYVETVFPYKRVFTKYEMAMVYNCISIQLQNDGIKKMYLDLLKPFDKEVSVNKGKLLTDTLETFVLDAGMNSNKTADFMGIHNNTVQYRLKRINEILGAEMTGNRIIPGLTMALALRRLEG
jgi:hypothetical protein